MLSKIKVMKYREGYSKTPAVGLSDSLNLDYNENKSTYESAIKVICTVQTKYGVQLRPSYLNSISQIEILITSFKYIILH